jgi:hypothetical protein
MGARRESIAHEMARMVIGGPLYYSASTALTAIDGSTLMLTGRQDVLHMQAHGGPQNDDVISGTRT